MKEKMIRLCDYNNEEYEPVRYHKIPSLWKRDKTGGFTEEYTSQLVEILSKSGMSMIISEKIDGTNIRVAWDGYNFSFWGRKRLSEIPESLLKKLESMFCNDKMESLFEQMFGGSPVILFGEGIGKKINGVSYCGGDYDFIVFDVWNKGHYVNYNDFVNIVSALGLTPAPVYEIPFDDTVSVLEWIENNNGSIPSLLDKNIIAEGFVLKPLHLDLYDNDGRRCIFKIKQNDYRKTE